jgi:hypothetical protein
MNKAAIRAAIEQDNPEIVGDLIRYANDLRSTGNIKAAADIKLQLLKIVATDEVEDDGGLLVFKQVRTSGPA